MKDATAQDLFDALCEPFPPEMVEWRIGSTNKEKTKCLPLCYIDARACMDRLDSVCGPDGWQCDHSPGANGLIICRLGLKMPSGEWLWKADGAGASDIEGEKGAISDSLKRAAVRWGIGRYLYELKATWIPLEDGKYISDAERKKLNTFYEDTAPKALWGVRAGYQAYRLLRKLVEAHVTQPSDVEKFKTDNSGEIALLPVKMRQNLQNLLDRVGGAAEEAA